MLGVRLECSMMKADVIVCRVAHVQAVNPALVVKTRSHRPSDSALECSVALQQ